MHKQIVRSNAGLASIKALAPRNTTRDCCNIRTTINNARALTTKLKHHWGQVLCRCSHNFATKRRATRKEDYVISLLKQCAVHIAVTLHNGNIVLVKCLGNHLLNYG